MAQLTFVDGDVLTASQINTYLMGEGGAWTSYTSTVAQGASTDIAKTVNYSKYARYGRTIHWTFSMSMTAAGGSAVGFTITLPVTAASASGVVGSGYFYDASITTRHGVVWNSISTTAASAYYDVSTAGAYGADPAITIASGDIIVGSITYEAAS